MSSISVFLILGGATAFAAKKIGSNEIKGNSITTGKLKKNAVTASKIKKNSITSAKIANAAVTNSKIADGSVTVQKLVSGFVAPTAEKLAKSANISAGGAVLAGSFGIAQANVTHTSTGFYCFTGLTPAPVGGLATVDYSESGSEVTIQLDTGQGPVCPAGTQAFVDPRDGVGNPVNAGFFVVLY
jgi:hypothetical protein